jgi:Glycosyl transferase family 11.
MIFVRINGRLGNQMFQYAFIFSKAKSCKTFFLLDIVNFPLILHKYFRIPFFITFINRVINHKLFKWIKNLLLKQVTKKIIHSNTALAEVITAIKDNMVYYEGYFQSVLYFFDFQKDIKRHFRIKKTYTKQFEKKYKSIFANHKVLTIHYRGGDYKSYGSDDLGGINMTLPWTYYENCLKQIQNIHEYKILVISDDLAGIQSHFKGYSNVSFEQNTEVIDLLLLMNSDALVISNSSFAWWGAYLNQKNALVFAPKYWLGFKIGKYYPQDINKLLDWYFVDVH